MRIFERLPLPALVRHQGGATAIEFSIVAVVFFMLFMGIVEYGLFMMTQVAIESAVTQAGRAGSVAADGVDRTIVVRDAITAKTAGLIDAALVTITDGVVLSDGSGGAPPAPDICLAPSGSYPCIPPRTCPLGTPWISGGDPSHHTCTGSTTANSAGGPGDLVEIRATYPWHVLFPILSQFFGTNGVVLIQSTTVVKNEN